MPTRKQSKPSVERLMQVFIYHPNTGFFIWRARPGSARETRRWNTRYAGRVAGHPSDQGYIMLCVDASRDFPASHAAWAIMCGVWPAGELDHRDGKPGNNAFSNLRPATKLHNARNRRVRSDNVAGLRGVSVRRRLNSVTYVARISPYPGKRIHLGCFATPQAAHAAYAEASRLYHGEYGRVL